MRLLISILLVLNLGNIQAQDFIHKIVGCAIPRAEHLFINAVGKEIFENHFNIDKTIVEVYDDKTETLCRYELDSFKTINLQATQFWLVYSLKEESFVLTELYFPFNLNCTTPWNLNDTKEIVKPYLKVLQNKVKVDLEGAIKIAKEEGLKSISEWDIDFEKRKLIWTIKDKETNKNEWKVIKINANRSRDYNYYLEIPID